MFKNAKQYNEPNSLVYQDAVALENIARPRRFLVTTPWSWVTRPLSLVTWDFTTEVRCMMFTLKKDLASLMRLLFSCFILLMLETVWANLLFWRTFMEFREADILVVACLSIMSA